MKVATWNVNGIRARQAQLAEWMQRDRPEVVCLQELKAESAQIPEPCKLEDYWGYWHCMRGYSGVSLQVRKDLLEREPAFTHPDFDMESRIVQADLGNLVIASVYVPNGGKDYRAKLTFLDELIAWAGELRAAGRLLVLCGDFNVAHAPRDVHPSERKHVVGQLREERERLDRLFAHGLVDVGRHVAPDDDQLFTWWAPWRNMRQRNIGWRLDYVAAAAALVDADTTCVAYREVGSSDHAPVIARLRDA
jgi:exodeoxyribonuclease-3